MPAWLAQTLWTQLHVELAYERDPAKRRDLVRRIQKLERSMG